MVDRGGEACPDLPLAVRDALADALSFALGDRRGWASLEAVRAVLHGGEAGPDRHAEATRRALAEAGFRGDEPWSEGARDRVRAYRTVCERGPVGVGLGERLAQARSLFEHALYFEVHEVLEPSWVRAREPERHWLQGIIQAAVSWYHQERGNHRGATSLARAAEAKLQDAPREWNGFALGEVVDAVGRWVEWLDAGARGRPPARAFERPGRIP